MIHTHGGGLRAVAAGLEARCIDPGERLYIPMPFFWTGGFSSGLLSTLVAGATLLTEAEPEPARTLALLERERATLFRGWPDQAARLAAHPAFAAADLSSLGDASLAAVLPPERRPAPGARANLFGMTETFGPYCGDRLDIDLPPDKCGSCGRPFDGIEVRIVDGRRDLAPRARTSCAASAAAAHARCSRPTAGSAPATSAASMPTATSGTTGRLDDMVKVKGATVYPSEVEAARCAPSTDVRQVHVTDVRRSRSARSSSPTRPVDAIAAAAKERLSAFKVPTRWLVTADASACRCSPPARSTRPR